MEDFIYNTGEFKDVMEGLELKAYTADFETTTDPEDCRVWAYGICDIGNPDNFTYGNSIEGFLEWCEYIGNAKVYFHNLGFDCTFIIDYLENNGWLWVDDGDRKSDYTYSTVISDMNQVYALTLYFTPFMKIVIYDSLKIIPLPVRDIAKAYGLEESKGEIDYEAFRPIGHELTPQEVEYLKNDCVIVAKALKNFLDIGLTKMTAGSNALYDYKKMMGGHKKFRRFFPILSDEEDEFIRRAYRGGYTYVNERYQGKKIGEGLVFDVNSLYPSVMFSSDGQKLPYGKAEWFDGEPKKDPVKPLWVAMVTCRFKVKDGFLPCIQLKGNFRFSQTEYLKSSNGMVTFTVTNVDWGLITTHYVVKDVGWYGGYKFKGNTNLFKNYVQKWTDEKIKAGHEGNAGKRQIAKLMLNSLYGKMATRKKVCSRRPVLEEGVVKYVDLEPTERDPIYLPVGVFITSYARYKTITSAQALYDRFIYADTDSLHIEGSEVPTNIEVDDFELGKWKLESEFSEAKFLRAKCYVEHEKGTDKLTVRVAGMPANCHAQVTLDNFEMGATYKGKLYQKRVKGGIVLEPGDMTIRG